MTWTGTFHIYGLRIIGSNTFFYIGCTCQMLNTRLKQHISESNSYRNYAKKKNVLMRANNGKIEIVKIITVRGCRRRAFKREKVLITEMLSNGHPITNEIY